MEDEKIFKLRSRKNDDQLSPTQYRTYIEPFMYLMICSVCVLLLIIGFASQEIFSFRFFYLSELFILNPKQLKEWGIYEAVSAKFSVIYTLIFCASYFISDKYNKVINYSIIKNDGLKFYHKDGLNEYKKHQDELEKGIQLLFKKTDGEDLILDKSTRELAFFITGEAGSGKTVLAERFTEHWVESGEKCVLQDPKGKYTEKLVKANVSLAVIAPWLENSSVIDYAKLIYSDNTQLTNEMIDFFIYSFAGFPNPKKPDFFDDGARTVLIAVTRKVVHEYQSTWSLMDWVTVAQDNCNVDKIIDVVKTFSPESGFLLDKDNPKTTGSILASMVATIIKIKKLALMWEGNKKTFDLKAWLYNSNPSHQFVALWNSQTNQQVASSVIASFINLASILVLDPEYLASKPAILHFTLDEFNSFARYVDINKFKQLMDLGREAGIRIEILQQRQTQANEYLNEPKQADDWLGAFQNRVYCRPANSDFELIKAQVGPHTEIQTEFSRSDNSQGHNMNRKTQEKIVHFEPSILQTHLGPKPAKGKGVYVCFNTVSNPVVARVLIPFKKVFCEERINRLKKEGKYKDREFKPKYKAFSRKLDLAEKLEAKKKLLQIKIEDTKTSVLSEPEKINIIQKTEIEISNVNNEINSILGIAPIESKLDEESILKDVVKDIMIEAIDPSGAIHLLSQASELLDIDNNNKNIDTHTSEVSQNKNKKKTIKEVVR